MPKLKPTEWRVQVRVFAADGFAVERESGSHIVMTKFGVARPVIVPKYPAVGIDIIRANMRTAHMSRERYFNLLAKN